MTTLLALVGLSPALAADTVAGASSPRAVSAEFARIWNQGSADVYLPLHTHHLRRAYDADLVATFNENPWGIGFGRSYKDAAGGWHGLYAMEFRDSHSRIEPIAGYGRLYQVSQYRGVSASLGYTAFVTARQDIANYAPVPGILPLASVESGRLSLMTTFMPGRHNNGNIFFVFGKYSFAR
jgi:palmitoyl transferase